MGRRKQENTFLAKKNIVWKIAIYLRLSKEDGNDVSNSIKNQKERIYHFLENSFDEPYQIVGVYIDDGLTGIDENRANYLRMKRAVYSGEANCVIVKDLSRLSRNMADISNNLDNEFVQYGIRFISLELPYIDSWKEPETMNNISVPLHSLLNEYHCRVTSEKIRNTFDLKRSKGEFIGAFAPFGYGKDPLDKNKLIVDPIASVYVKDIFNWFAVENLSINAIVKRLNENQIPTPTKYKRSQGLNYTNPHARSNNLLWWAKTVKDILTNEMYIGNMIQGKTRVKSFKIHVQEKVEKDNWFRVENTHEAIIDNNTFMKVQEMFKRDTYTFTSANKPNLFSGYLKCNDCGMGMRRSKAHDKYYYMCRTYKERSKTACTRHSIREDLLEEAVFETIKLHINLVVSMSDLIKQINEAPITNNQSMRLDMLIHDKENELIKISRKKDTVYDNYLEGIIDKAEYIRYKANFENQYQDLEKAIFELKQERELLAKGVENNNPYFQSFLKYRNVERLERETVVDLIDVIYVKEDGSINIVFNYKDQYQIIEDYINSNKDLLQPSNTNNNINSTTI